MTLYERLGGAGPVGRIVDELSRRILDDERLGPAFAAVNLDILQQHRTAYLTVLLEGPEGYEGRSMREAHQPIGLVDADMDAFLALLQSVLDDAGVGAADAASVLRALERLRPAVVAATPPGR